VKLLKDIIRVSVVLVADAIDEIITGESREDLVKRIRAAADRGAVLALENDRLREEVDKLRFNGPTLWSDEVKALRQCIDICTDEGIGDTDPLEQLLSRCDHAPMTSDELMKQVESITNGTAQLLDWDDVFKDDPGEDVDA
jgi:hypothetical protein